MRWLIGVLIDLAIGGTITLYALSIDPANLRGALALGVIACVLAAALLGLYLWLRPKVVILRRVAFDELLARPDPVIFRRARGDAPREKWLEWVHAEVEARGE